MSRKSSDWFASFKKDSNSSNNEEREEEEDNSSTIDDTMSTSLTDNAISPPTNSNSHDEEFANHPSAEVSMDSDDSSYEDDEDDYEEDSDAPLSLEELLYSASSFHAIARPVSTTMTLAALAAVYVNNEQTLEAGAREFASAYQVFSLSDSGDDGTGNSTGKNLAMSIANTFIIVLVIAAMTFGIVLLYKYRCMKFLIGYMILSSASLLGVLGDYMANIAVEIYRIPIDVITYYGSMYNFAIVGVVAIFYQRGVPMGVTQMYLVFTSVILAWHLSHFDEWTAWTLLVMLAFYDLCAVLTPCGPLKALVNLMQEEDSPEMPGLLYEAALPAGTQRPGQGASSRTPNNGNGNGENDTTNSNSNSNIGPTRNDNISVVATTSTVTSATNTTTTSTETVAANNTTSSNPPPTNTNTTSTTERGRSREPRTTPTTTPTTSHSPSRTSTDPSLPLTDTITTIIPLAIAKVYKLKLVSTYGTSSNVSNATTRRRRNRAGVNENSPSVNPSPLLADWEEASTSMEFYERDFTANELTSDVEVELPRNGGRLERKELRRGVFKYDVLGRDGEFKRSLTVDKRGRVFELTDSFDDDDSMTGESSSIRLGLGDFIFYSVLVAKAALYSFTTFAACFLVIMAGLGGTLVILSVYRSALPALPISIFLGVIFYLLTRLIIEPWIEIILVSPLYV